MGESGTGWLRWQAESLPALRGTLRAQLHFTLPRDQAIDAHVTWNANRLRVDGLHAELLGSALLGHAIWEQATLLGPRLPIFLGDLRADFYVDTPGRVVGAIRDLGGSVQVTGNLRMDLVGYRIDMETSPRDPRLAASLSQLGEPLADGSRRLQLHAVWWWKRTPRARTEDAGVVYD